MANMQSSDRDANSPNGHIADNSQTHVTQPHEPLKDPHGATTIELNHASTPGRQSTATLEDAGVSRSLAQLEPKRAAQQLDLALERFRIVNAGMTRVVELFLAQTEAALGQEAGQIRNEFGQKLFKEGISSEGITLRMSALEDAEGSLYIQTGSDNIRYLWLGANEGQDVYLNDTSTYVKAVGRHSAQVIRFEGRELDSVFNESDTQPFSGSRSEYNQQQTENYQRQLEEYNSVGQRFMRLFGKGEAEPSKPELLDTKSKLAPAEIGLTAEKHVDLVQAVDRMSSAIERATIIIQRKWTEAVSAQGDSDMV